MKILKKWIKLEMEHTNQQAEAKRIVQDHLREFGKGYYPALIKMEKKLKRQ
jgi:hypothetical protein